MCGKAGWFRDQVHTREGPQEAPQNENSGLKKKKPKPEQKAKTEGVLFVPLTPNAELKKSIQDIEDALVKHSTVGRVKVVERAGISLSNLICNQTPWTKEHCMREACVACKNKPGSCKRRNATYVVECGECKLEGTKSKYHGETHRTLWDRFSKHENAIRKLDKSNALAAHWP